MNQCKKFNLNDKLTAAVAGFADTLPMFMSLYKEEGWANFKQTTIVQNILQQPYAAHNALEDAKILQDVVHKSRADNKDILKHSFPLMPVLQEIDRDSHKAINSDSLQDLLSQKVCGVAMANKIASSGLNLTHLKLAFQRSGLAGIASLFSDKDIHGHIRVTNSKKIVNAVAEYLAKVCT
jgi:hypothetical protein